MNKILTIVVPTYNMEKYLDRCLNSLIAPDKGYRNQVEVIVVIDGATDKSSAIAHAYEEKFPDVFKVIDKENGHYGSCINAALKVASGKYIKLVDADDYLDSISLSHYLSILAENDIDVVLSGFRTINEAGQITSTFVREIKHGAVLEWPDVIESFCNNRNLAMHEVAYKTAILKETNYKQTEGIAYTDQEWVFYPMQNVKTFMSLDLVLYNYLLGRDGQSVSPQILCKSIPALLTIAKRMIEEAPAYLYASEIQRYFQNNSLWLIEYTYSIYLLSYNLNDNKEELIKFDNLLHDKNRDIYNRLNDSTIGIAHIKWHLIRLWRKKNYTPPLFLKLRNFVKSSR